MTVFFLLGLAAVFVLVFWVISLYNALVRGRNLVREGLSGIDVQLKKRADLIPNLVETVKGYLTHEREVLQRVTELRAQSAQAGDVAAKAQVAGLLGQALGRLFAVAESYPDLKANQNFLELQSQLADVEQSLEMSRRYYNGAVRDYNIAVESFPSNIVAGIFQFVQADFFEIDNPGDRAVPSVSF